MAEHEHGKMNIDVQEKTFDTFIKWSGYAVVIIVVLLILIALING